MNNQVRTIDFLPEVFRTDSNSQFLSATLDVLTSQPNLKRVQGYIGSKYGYGLNSADKYVVEPTKEKTNYQLEPSVVFLKSDTQRAQDFISYPGILKALKNYGGQVSDHNRLFENEFYSWDPFIDYDKIVNYSQYHWLPIGPDAIRIENSTIFQTNTFGITSTAAGFTTTNDSELNSTISLLRGGSYAFQLSTSDPDEVLWIQGTDDFDGMQDTLNTRDILGAVSNGSTSISFDVPAANAQNQYNLPGSIEVDIVSSLPFADINNSLLANISTIDGISSINGKTLLLYNSTSQTHLYKIVVSGGIITLTQDAAIPLNQKIIVNSGNQYRGRTFYKNASGAIVLIPYLSAVQNTLYYRSSKNPQCAGMIKIYDSNETSYIDVADILGKKKYVSPNSVTFTNGLKISFGNNVVPIEYANTQYYVEGVGHEIVLLPVDNFQVTEITGEIVFNLWDSTGFDMTRWDSDAYAPPSTPDYISISRNSSDYNPWTRGNRWFHQSVLDTNQKHLGYITKQTTTKITRAQRPIIEFRGNLQLWDSGTLYGGTISMIDQTVTNALAEVSGQTSWAIDGISLAPGDKVVFAADDDPLVRRSVYLVTLVDTGSNQLPVINLSAIATVDHSTQINVKFGTTYRGTTWRYDSDFDGWIRCQMKLSLNQAPLFDIIDANGISLGNSDFYQNTNFVGSKLFSYTAGVGAKDTVLGFPIAYSGVNNIGDINFSVNFNSDTFIYDIASQETTQKVNTGFVKHNLADGQFEKLSGWIKAVDSSFQYQVFEFDIVNGSTVTCDVPVFQETVWNPVQVYADDNLLERNEYSYSLSGNSTVIQLSPARTAKLTVLLYSKKTSNSAYYSIPTNLASNPFNADVTSVDVGDIRTQLKTIYSNAPGVTGVVYGYNNLHDLGSVYQYGTSIIKNSASMVLPGIFLRKADISFFDALQFNRDEYYNYKALLVDIASKVDFSIDQKPQQILDAILYEITSIKNNNDAFFWTDTVFSGNPYSSNTYNFTVVPSSRVFALSKIYDFTRANYDAVALYITRTEAGITSTRQLIRNIDYVIESNSPSVTVTAEILDGDILEISEFTQTYGSYCPSTPTTLGLYPATVPAVILDDTYITPTYFIIGHDGSATKLYGPLQDGHLVDFRDIALLEFEQRIYNNIKGNGVIPLRSDDIMPGQFRATDYTREEIQDIYRVEFLNWVGTHRVDFKTQYFDKNNSKTFNYNQSSNKLTNTAVQQGYWRGIFNWLYDTDRPHSEPWRLLGFTIKPDWWDTRYGEAPYTGDNIYMWDEISRGYIWNDGQPYINKTRIRDRLLDIIPVDSAGNLRSAFDVIIGNYNALTFNSNWNVGDGAPAEAAYLSSSAWPFDLMKILALAQPAKFFNLFADMDNYRYSSEFDQYLYKDRYHLDSRALEIYGAGTASRSYINWIVDYVNLRGINGHEVVSSYLKNVDVRLTYRVSGFSSKEYLKFYIERATPNSKNTSFLIPDESYTVLLYDNVPEDTIRYSSVILQRVKHGWTVWGNNQSRQYFSVSVPKPNGVWTNIASNTTAIRVASSYYDNREQIVPYGTLFYSKQAVAEFLSSYGSAMRTKGVDEQQIQDSVVYDWNRMIKEFLAWADQQWEIGSTIAINPCAQKIVINREGTVVQPLTVYQQNFILNQNLLPVQSENATVVRDNHRFTVNINSIGDTIAQTNLNLHSVEHGVVFDNTTVFNDLVYNITSGFRQQRLILKGYKTATWNGYIDAQGFILNENNIEEWSPNKKYPKGMIVTHKNLYWSANKLIEPTLVHNQKDWTLVDYDNVKTGLLSNPSTNAYESLFFYDSNRANLRIDEDLLGFSLIGYRPRNYLAAADLSDITQINVFKNIVTEKGTALLANSFRNTQFDQGKIDYTIKENWALNVGSFGSVLSSNFVEFVLDENVLTGNPALVEFSETPKTATTHQVVTLGSLSNWERPPSSANFLPTYQYQYSSNSLPSAGYVDMRDATYQYYEISELNDDPLLINNIIVSDTIWIANYKNSWNIFSVQSLNTNCVQVDNNQNGTITVTFEQPHNLAVDDHFAINNFSPALNKFYTVAEVPSIQSVVVEHTMDRSVTRKTGYGIAFKLVSRRFAQASDAAENTTLWSEYSTKKIWVDTDTDNNWAVWGASPVHTEKQLTTTGADIGHSVGYSAKMGYVYSDISTNTVYRTKNNVTTSISGPARFGQTLCVVDNRLFVASQTAVACYVLSNNDQLTKIQDISLANVTSIACSANQSWLYCATHDTSTVHVFHRAAESSTYVSVTQIVGADGFANSIATTTNGGKLVVGAASRTVNGLSNSGTAHIYSRVTERFIADGVKTYYATSYSIPGSAADVYLNGVLVSATVTTAGVTLASAPANGTLLTVDYGHITLSQTFTSSESQIGALFGQSVDTNRYGATIAVGAPYEISNTTSIANIEGCVYIYINGAQRYGTVTLNSPQTQADDVILVNGFAVRFLSTTSNVTTIANRINSQTGINVVATANTQANTVTISIRNTDIETPYNLLDIVAEQSVVERMNIEMYAMSQRIIPRNYPQRSKFGQVVRMNERDSMIVAAPTAPKIVATMFDTPDSCKQNNTILDNGTTTFIDQYADVGLIYHYDYLPAANENITNTGKYALGQYLASVNSNYGDSTNFGSAVAYANDTIVVGAPDWYPDRSGTVTSFTTAAVATDPCKIIKPTCWYIDKKPLAQVDINKLNNISIFNSDTGETTEYLDYFDTHQGKLLGAISTNIDIISGYDPAGYDTDGIQWGVGHVGKIWLDTTNLRMLNCNQPDITYNAQHWGMPFVGSSADVYTWIESTELPVDYTGNGYPLAYDKYVTQYFVNNATNNINEKYYYWVRSYEFVPAGKTLSPLVLSQYILDPLSSGIAYLAPITTNTVALYNSQSLITSDSSSLHLGYGNSIYENTNQSVWKLIRTNSDDFLSGINDRSDLYLKYLDSFSGKDISGKTVPDSSLPVALQTGTSFSPRQSMFIDRREATKNFIQYANQVLKKYPITEIRPNLSYIKTVTSQYDTTVYWKYDDWWDTGYNEKTKAAIEVKDYLELLKFAEKQLVTGLNGLTIALVPGLIAKVKSNEQGRSEYYVYLNSTWTRIGLQFGTIQILPTLWQTTQDVSMQTRWIVRWLHELVYTSDLREHRNTSLMLMFNYINSEAAKAGSKSSWLMKTSMIDVNHKIRELLPYKKFQRDNQEFLSGYLDEIKPYHVVIKDFVYEYSGTDTVFLTATDFDLPSEYSSATNKYTTPKLVEVATREQEFTRSDQVWNTAQYSDWFNNFGLSLSTVTSEYTDLTATSRVLEIADNQLYVGSVYGLKDSGIILLGKEQIRYGSVNRVTNVLGSLSRGFAGTQVARHSRGTTVRIRNTGVLILDPGRGYTNAPKITVLSNDSYEPRAKISLSAAITDGQLSSISVNDIGGGYKNRPTIIVDGSNIIGTFISANIDAVQNTITINDHDFVSGDSVVYSTTDSTAKFNLRVGEYYYVRVISSNTIALYTNYKQAMRSTGLAQRYQFDGRVNLKNSSVASSAVGILTVTARISLKYESTPVRGITPTVAFDRLSYQYNNEDVWDHEYYGWDVLAWDSNEQTQDTAYRIHHYYNPSDEMPGKNVQQIILGSKLDVPTVSGQLYSDLLVDEDESEYIINSVTFTQTLSSPDTAFQNTALLLRCSESAGSSAIVDSSYIADSKTVPATWQWSNTTSKFSQTALKYGTAPGPSWSGNRFVRRAGTGYSIECWFNSVTSYDAPEIPNIFAVYDSNSTFVRVSKYGNLPGKLNISATSTPVLVTYTPDSSGWVHLAWTIDENNTARFYVSGSLVWSKNNYTMAGTYDDIWSVRLGATDLSAYNGLFSAYIDGFRVTNGVSRYTTSTFSVPSTQFEDAPLQESLDANTVLLCHFDGFANNNPIDSSTYTNALSFVNSATLNSNEKRFGAASLGVSASANQYCTVNSNIQKFNFENLDFTVEFWMNPRNIAGQEILLFSKQAVADINSIALLLDVRVNSTAAFIIRGSTDGLSHNIEIQSPPHHAMVVTQQWQHVALVRKGSTLTVFWNGLPCLDADISTVSLFSSNTAFSIAGSSTATHTFDGYIDEFRVTRNVARYTTVFSPATAPFPVPGILLDTNSQAVDFSGGTFEDAYAPEELVSGVISDVLNLTVSTAGADPMIFRLIVDRTGAASVFNQNETAMLQLASTFNSSNISSDILYLNNVAPLIDTTVLTLQTDINGQIIITGIDPREIISLTIDTENQYSWLSVSANKIIATIQDISPSTTVTVTIVTGGIIFVSGELIGFSTIDTVNNTLTGLRRGLYGTTINTRIAAGQSVQGILSRHQMPGSLYDKWWYDGSGTLATDTSEAALFLQYKN